jgi:hypothetical protein
MGALRQDGLADETVGRNITLTLTSRQKRYRDRRDRETAQKQIRIQIQESRDQHGAKKTEVKILLPRRAVGNTKLRRLCIVKL